jgi:hypothetical protein
LCCDCRDVWLFEDAGTSWRDMTSGSMYWSLQASTVCGKIVQPAIKFNIFAYMAGFILERIFVGSRRLGMLKI